MMTKKQHTKRNPRWHTYTHNTLSKSLFSWKQKGWKKGSGVRYAFVPSLHHSSFSYYFPFFVDNCDKKEIEATCKRMIAWIKREAGRSNKRPQKWRQKSKHACCTQGQRNKQWGLRFIFLCNVTLMCTPRCKTWCVPDVCPRSWPFSFAFVLLWYIPSQPPLNKRIHPLFSVMKYEYECVLATSTPCPFFFSFFLVVNGGTYCLVSPSLCLFVAVDVVLAQTSLFFFFYFSIRFSFINILQEEVSFWVFSSCFLRAAAPPAMCRSVCLVCLPLKKYPLFIPYPSLSILTSLLYFTSSRTVQAWSVCRTI